MIKYWIQCWLGIDETVSHYEFKAYQNNYSDLKVELTNFRIIYNQFVIFTNERLRLIEDRLRPNDRERLEQVKTAFEIGMKYLNELNTRISERQIEQKNKNY